MKLVRLLAALVVVAALGGCSDDEPEPRIEPSESESASSPAAPTSTPPETTEPPEVLGPEQTVQAWVDARNVLMLEGDASAVDALSAPNCRTCRLSIDPVKEVHQKGGRFETSGWRIASSRIRWEADHRAVVSTALVIPGGRTFPEAGAEAVSYTEQKRIVLVSVSSADTGWLVSKLVYLS